MRQTKYTLCGKDGELFITHKGEKFADVGRFTAVLTERAVMERGGRLGEYAVGTGLSAKLRLDDVTITNEAAVNELISEIDRGQIPILGFQGSIKQRNGLAAKVVFRSCGIADTLDYKGLIKGFIWELLLSINEITDEQAEMFKEHG